MRFVFILAFVLNGVYVFAQSRMGLYFTGARAHRNFSTTRTHGILPEIPKFGYATGISYEQHIKKRLWIITGLQFANKGYRTPEIEVQTSGFMPGAFKSFNSRYSLYETGIPVSALYYLTNTQWKFFASGGIEINYLVGVRETLTITRVDDSKIRHVFKYNRSNYNILNIAGQLGAGMERDYKKYTIRLFSIFSYTLNNYYKKQTGSKMHPYWNGLGFAVYRNFAAHK